MKTKLLLILTLVLTSQFVAAQCTTTVSDFGNNTSITSYNIIGDVDVTINLDNTVTLDLGTNFMTASGPDVRAYLVKSNNLSDSMLANTPIANLDNIQFGLVGSCCGFGNLPINGAKSFTITIPPTDNIEDYDTVFFYCLNFNQFWDFGKFIPFNSNNCTLLSIDENSLLDTVSFFPNPTNDNITIKNERQLNLSIEIFNVLGKKVLETENSLLTEQSINLASLNSGVYLVQIKADGKSITKKLVKQ